MRLSAADHLEIAALVTEYAWFLDHQQWHGVVDLCTEDALLTIRGRDIVGRSGLTEWAESRAQKKRLKTLHQMTNLRLEAEADDRATGVAALVLYVATTGTRRSHVDLVGEYRDEYVRFEAGWRFKRRHLVELGKI